MTEIERLRDHILDRVAHWAPELESLGDRSTMWYGIMQKSSAYLEDMLWICVRVLLPAAGEEGAGVVENVCGGKPPHLMTMGQLVQLLAMLDERVSQNLSAEYPEIGLQGRLLGRRGVKDLQKLSKIRNDFVHGRKSGGYEETVQFLMAVREFCKSNLVSTVAELQRLAGEGDHGEAEEHR